MELLQTEINSERKLTINGISPISNDIEYLSKNVEIMRETYSASMRELAKSMEIMMETYSAPMQELVKNMEIMIKTYSISAMKSLTSVSVSTNIQESMKGIIELPKIAILYNKSISSYEEVDYNDYLQKLYNGQVSQDINEVNDIFLDDSLSIQEKLFSIWEKFKNKNIFIILLVWYFIIFPICTPLKEGYDKWFYESVNNIVQSTIEKFHTDNQLLNKSIKKEVSKELSNTKDTDKNSLLNTYRFVNCDSLNVRVSNMMKSKSIYTLSRGTVVKIINKQKNWTNIEYKNEDETIVITGWVNTRYISRFK